MNTLRMLALYDTLPLPDLADRLEELDERRTPAGWTPREATHRLTLERRVIGLVAGRDPGGEPLQCRLELKLRSSVRIGPATLVAIDRGGLVLESDARWPIGSAIEIELLDGEHALRIRGSVATNTTGRFRVRLLRARSEAEERRIRRFVLEALRHRTEWTVRMSS
jgi:hypothetical protein